MGTIGVLTWCRNLNYGGALQALALRTAIEKMGYRAELVNYEQNQSDISYASLLRFPKGYNRIPLWMGWIVEFVIRFFVNGCFVSSLVRLIKSRQFISRYIHLSVEYYPNYTALCQQVKYATIVVGSDQVWNPRFFNGVPGYLMGEMPRNVRRIAYAPSIAVSKLGSNLKYFKEVLPDYVAVSVRENSCVKELEKECGISIKWVVDPTLLLSAEEWIELLELPKPKDGGFIMYYWLSDIEDILPKLFAIAHASGKKIRLFSNINAFRVKSYSPKDVLKHLKLRVRLFFSRKISYCQSADPCQFLSSLATSSAVVSDSFHALMFSIIFRKPVKIVVPPERVDMSSRIDDFLSNVGMQDVRTVTISSNLFSTWRGYSNKILGRLNCWISFSRLFLEEALIKAQK